MNKPMQYKEDILIIAIKPNISAQKLKEEGNERLDKILNNRITMSEEETKYNESI
jgi:hypothetical protein